MKKIITILFILLVVVVWIWQVLADYQGANSPAAAENDSSFGTVAWSNPLNVATSDNQWASASFNRIGQSYYLKATDFGFSIPEGSIIEGILVEIERYAFATRRLSAIRIRDSRVQLIKAGIIGSEDKADRNTNWPNLETLKSYGGPTDLWGLSWSAADINSNDFGVAIAIGAQTLGGFRITGYIDHIRITVYYSPAPEPASWKGAEDTPIIDVNKNENIRLRIQVANQGSEALDYDYQLEYAQKNGDLCGDGDESFAALPETAGNEHFRMTESSYFINGEPTTPQLTTPDSFIFMAGRMVESPSNSSGNLSLSFENYTEIEFVFQATNQALDGQSYCFRVTNAGTALDNYSIYPELRIITSP